MPAPVVERLFRKVATVAPPAREASVLIESERSILHAARDLVVDAGHFSQRDGVARLQPLLDQLRDHRDHGVPVNGEECDQLIEALERISDGEDANVALGVGKRSGRDRLAYSEAFVAVALRLAYEVGRPSADVRRLFERQRGFEKALERARRRSTAIQSSIAKRYRVPGDAKRFADEKLRGVDISPKS